jgi:alanyl-tRNA synthetase
VRRIEAVTGRGALDVIRRRFQTLQSVAAHLGTTPAGLEGRVAALQADLQTAEEELARLRRKLAQAEFEGLLAQMQSVDGVPVLAAQVSATSVETLREMGDWFRAKVKSGVMVLGTVTGAKPHFVAAVTDDLVRRGVKAGDIVKGVAQVVGGGGGGRPHLATAGGRDPERLDEALMKVPDLVRAALKG